MRAQGRRWGHDGCQGREVPGTQVSAVIQGELEGGQPNHAMHCNISSQVAFSHFLYLLTNAGNDRIHYFLCQLLIIELPTQYFTLINLNLKVSPSF